MLAVLNSLQNRINLCLFYVSISCQKKSHFPFNVAFVIVCYKPEAKALKPDCNVPLKNFITLLICDDPLEADTLALLSAACYSSSRVAVCTWIRHRTAHLANKMRSSPQRLGTCREVFGCKYWNRAEGDVCTGWHKKTGTFEKPNKNWRNPRKKVYWQKLNHYNLPFKGQ